MADSGVALQNATLALGLLTLVAFNLRTGLIGVGPVLPDVTNDLHLSHTQGSLLVALPTALMGLAALPGGRLVDRFGARAIITVGLALVAIAGGLRAAASVFPILVLLTAFFGIGIGISQPGLPRLGLRPFSEKCGTCYRGLRRRILFRFGRGGLRYAALTRTLGTIRLAGGCRWQSGGCWPPSGGLPGCRDCASGRFPHRGSSTARTVGPRPRRCGGILGATARPGS